VAPCGFLRRIGTAPHRATVTRGAVKPGSRGRAVYGLYWATLVALVLAFLAKTGPASYWLIGAAMVGVSVALYFRSPLLALCTLPGAFLLGIIARTSLAGISLQLGDIQLFALVVTFLTTRGIARPLFVGRPGLFPLGVAILALSWIFSVDFMGSAVTMFNLVELLCVFVLTANILVDEADATTLFRAWWGTVTLCSALIIVSYVRGEPLIIDSETEGFVSGFQAMKETSTSFLRASFFITTFNYPLACAVVTLVVYLLASSDAFRSKVYWLVALAVMIASTVLLGNRSVMAAIAFGSMLALLMLGANRRTLLTLAGLAVVGVIIIQVALARIDAVISPRQLFLFLERIQGADSLFIRFETWASVLDAVASSPHALLIGLGPDASTRAGGVAFLEIFRGEQAADNQWMFILLNYGVVILALYLRYFASGMWLLYQERRSSHRLLVVMLLMSFVTWQVVGVGQQLGAVKAIALGVQLAAMLELLRNGRLGQMVPSRAKAAAPPPGLSPAAGHAH
jgi:hypothetical protein